jgi:Fe-S-cluster-containing dehydrogenase component
MENDRRSFIKYIGVGVAALVAKPALDLFFKFRTAEATTDSEGALLATRWAMVIDIEACKAGEGCHECIDACHRVHNVPDLGDTKEEIKWLWTAPYDKVFPEQEYASAGKDLSVVPIPVLCNHCDDPPCIKVCPTKATWKREDGIVMVDYHRCIGCRYCMAGCPYGARSFNWRDPRPFLNEVNGDFPTRMRGVVEKCNFCAERLARGLVPACVEVCPEKALIFGDLNDPDSEVREVLRKRHVLQRLPELGTKPCVYYVV